VSAGAARLCGRCGRVRPISKRASPDGPDICSGCYRPPTAVCTVCGDERPCSGVAAGRPVCSRCRPRRASRCALRRIPPGGGALAGGPGLRSLLHRRTPAHRHLRHLWTRAASGRAARARREHLRRVFRRRTRRTRLHRLWRGGQALHARLVRPVHSCASHRRAARRPQRLRADRARRGPRRHRDDHLPAHRPELAAQGSRRTDLGRTGPRRHRADPRSARRAPKPSASRLSARGARRPRCPTSTNLLAQVPAGEDRCTLTAYATWRVLHRARRRTRTRPTPITATRHATLRLRASIALLEWLRGNDIRLDQLRQADIDQWLLTGPPILRREVADFLGWTAARRFTPPLTLPARPTVPERPAAKTTTGGSRTNCCTTPTSPPSIASPAASCCCTANNSPASPQ
jgi:hypothetical protein